MGQLLQKDSVSGALGAVVAEVLGEFLVANASKRLPELYAQAAAQGPVSRKAIDDLYQEEIKKAVDWSHIGAAGAALVAGQDVNLAARAADNALSHNLGPSVLIGAVMVGSTAWTAYDVYDTYQKEGVEAALEKLVTQGVIDVATRGVFKVAGKLYPHPELAWAAALKHVPFLNEMSQALSHLGSKVQRAFVKKGASTKPASSMKAPPVSKATDKAKKSQKADKVEKAPKADKVEKKVREGKKERVGDNVDTSSEIKDQYVPRDKSGKPLNLPRDKDGVPIPDSNNPHSQLGWREGRKGGYRQTREFNENGKEIKTTDWTDHGRGHPNPHDHYSIPSQTGGTAQRGPAEAFKITESQ